MINYADVCVMVNNLNHSAPFVFLITCEHAGNEVPHEYAGLFEGTGEILKSHRGWDPGARELALKIAQRTGAEPFLFPYTRLLIEPNRSITHPRLISDYTKGLSYEEKKELIKQFYLPYRMEIMDHVFEMLKNGKHVLHLSIHTFTSELHGRARNFDAGLLYDPSREMEKKTCKLLKKSILKFIPDFRVRMNAPYKGISDGLTTCLRDKTGSSNYTGIEIEINQVHTAQPAEWRKVCQNLADAVEETIRSLK